MGKTNTIESPKKRRDKGDGSLYSVYQIGGKIKTWELQNAGYFKSGIKQKLFS